MLPSSTLISVANSCAIRESRREMLVLEAKGVSTAKEVGKYAKWEERFDELKRYKRANKNTNVPITQGPLGRWVSVQRREYRKLKRGEKSSMENKRIRALEGIGFKWRVSAKKVSWEVRFRELIKYHKEHGHTNVPQTQGPLGHWVNNQRTAYKKFQLGESSSLTDTRVEAMESLRFEWRLRNEQLTWEEQFKKLRRYFRNHGKQELPPSNGSLGVWLAHQRREYGKFTKGEKSNITKERIKALNKLNPNWRSYVRNEELTWNSRLGELRQFQKEHKHCNVPQSFGPLGSWVINQRVDYRKFKRGEKSSMSQERINTLEELGFEWFVSTQPMAWRLQYNNLLEYKEENGNTNVPRTYGPLGTWVSAQRKEFHKFQAKQPSLMTQERMDALNVVGFEWRLRKETKKVPWDARLQELREFYEQHGHSNVPSSLKSLFKWTTRQRSEYKKFCAGKKSDITKERIKSLEKLDFYWSLSQLAWEGQADELRKFQEEHGHCNVSCHAGKLGTWVFNQRKEYRKFIAGEASSMTEERKTVLDEIGFQWDAPPRGRSSKSA
uniref:Helicase-associated domain-containing protein n=1 Tax=Ditylum brightwellii TaxID=49249 RepID=A0A7S4QDV9_9STRA